MGDAVQHKFLYHTTGAERLSQAAEKEGNMDVGLITLVIELFVKERIQFLLQFVLSAQSDHAVKEHGSTPAILPACALVKSIAAHLGVVGVNLHEFAGPDRIEKFLATLLPLLVIGLLAQFL